jgi:DNA-binding NarL/FixJ family response regulator
MSFQQTPQDCTIDWAIFPMPKNIWELVAKQMALSPRHKEIVERMLHGRQTKQIASDLGSREATIETHLKRIYRYHGVNGRIELMLLVFRLAMKCGVHRNGDTNASDA